ncbi:hypothetical protein [Streptomyces gardneri]|uniref:hypothetical protein n=1 Tax=Streptomyces gardneri TaxID=66892 RepID=UPI0036AB05B4
MIIFFTGSSRRSQGLPSVAMDVRQYIQRAGAAVGGSTIRRRIPCRCSAEEFDPAQGPQIRLEYRRLQNDVQLRSRKIMLWEHAEPRNRTERTSMAGPADAFQSITFAAWRDRPPGQNRTSDQHYVTLAERLVRLGSFGLGLAWKAQIDSAPLVTRFAEIEKASSGAGIGTLELLALVGPDLQFVDADFAGYAGEELKVVLREFDSTSWDLCTTDASVLREFRQHFPDAVPTPEDVLQETSWPTERRET